MNRRLSLWFLLLAALLGVTYFGFEAGLLAHVWDVDVSKLSFVITVLFYSFYLRLGYLIYRDDETTVEDLEPGYEAAEMSMALGMLGTVIGFIMMTGSFAGVDFSSIENVKQLFELATTGMSTALYTTAAGLVSSIVLRASHYALQRRLEE